jgi:hypothetical protein
MRTEVSLQLTMQLFYKPMYVLARTELGQNWRVGEEAAGNALFY